MCESCLSCRMQCPTKPRTTLEVAHRNAAERDHATVYQESMDAVAFSAAKVKGSCHQLFQVILSITWNYQQIHSL